MFRRLISVIDWRLYSAVVLLSVSGIFMLASINGDFFSRQIIWILIGIAVSLFISMIDIRSFITHKGFLITMYGLVVILLLSTLLFAPDVKGNRAWIVIGSFQFQPAELAKIVLVILLAVFFSRQHVRIAHWGVLLSSLFISAGFVLLVGLQPDLGSALLLLFLWAGFVLLSGIPLRHLLILLVICSAMGGFLWQGALEDYQKDRILSVFAPSLDPLGSGYNVIQSKIALGSGGLFGKGFGQGTQVQLGFLPEAHNDFIFASMVEEGGVIFGVFVLILLFLLVFRLIRMGMNAPGGVVAFLCLGAGLLFFVHMIVNLGSVLGFFPVIGVTLPFVSYGGSSILMGYIIIGIVQSLYAHR